MKRFLVVDDSKTMQRIISQVVSQVVPDSEIFVANDGREAFKIYSQEQSLDIILTDWNMPNMNGLELVKAIRNENKKIPIIMITTEGGKSEVLTALKSGVNNYIVKPFNAETLKEKLATFLK